MTNSEIKAPKLEMRDMIVAAAAMFQDSATGEILFSEFHKRFGIDDKNQRTIFSFALRDYRPFKIRTAGHAHNAFAYIGELKPTQVEMQLRGSKDGIVLKMLEKWANACEEEIVKTFKIFSTCGVKSSDLKNKVCARVLWSISNPQWIRVTAELRRRGCVTKGDRSCTWTVGPNHPDFEETSND